MIATIAAKLSVLSLRDIIFCLGAALVFAGAPLLFLFIVYRALRTGGVRARYGEPYRRDEKPIYFWLLIVLYTGLVLGIGGMGVFFGIQLWTNR